jgi:TrpR-related protein YerC/YecD
MELIMSLQFKDKDTDYLMKSILSLKTMDECYRFFEDVCTIAEIKAMSQRIVVAKMLDEHHIYHDIVEKTGASTATISRVNRCLNYGSDGYRITINRLKENEE